MRTIRRRNWLIKRIALGLAIAAVAAPVAQAKVDEGSTVQSNGFQAFVTDFPSYAAGSVADIGALPVSARDYSLAGAQRVRLAHSLPRWTDPGIVATSYGTPRATANAHKPHLLGGALARGDSQASWSQIAPLLADQRSATGFDWKDAGIGAGLAFALVLLGGGAVLASRHVGRAQTA
jgi:hypothetical protein